MATTSVAVKTARRSAPALSLVRREKKRPRSVTQLEAERSALVHPQAAEALLLATRPLAD